MRAIASSSRTCPEYRVNKKQHRPPPSIDSLLCPVRPVRMGAKAAHVFEGKDGSLLLRNAQAPVPVTETWNQRLVAWAEKAPDRLLLTEAESASERRGWTFGDALRDARSLAAALLGLPLSPDRPIAILAENSINCARITLGAMFAGIPAAPVSPSYALLSNDYAKLKMALDSIQPGAIYVADGERFGAAVLAALPSEIPIVTGGSGISGRDIRPIEDLLATPATERSLAVEEAIDLEMTAKILFTSGSSGAPKPVILSHRMLSDNRAQNMLVYKFLEDEPPVMVDWLPWHHTFGGNNNFGFALWAGGTLHIDDGRPTPGHISKTVENLKRYQINLFMSSPSGFEALIPHLRQDSVLRDKFFANLKVMQYGGAMLATALWKEIDDIAVATTGTRILMISGLGSTECGPTAMQSSWEQHRRPEAGLPVPGVTAKLVPFQGSLELRLAGACVTRGYWNRPDLTAQAFDEDGFFLTGDIVKPIDPEDLAKGLLFEGRISDNFKLTSGTWVSVSPLRLKLVNGLAPVLTDAVIVGAQRAYVSAIGFPDMAAAREIAGLPSNADDAAVLESPVLKAWIQDRLGLLAADAGGKSHRIDRLVLEAELPSLANGELSDKSAASASAVLARRAAVVEELYAEPAISRVIVVM